MPSPTLKSKPTPVAAAEKHTPKPRPRRGPSVFPFHELSDEELITPQTVADWLQVSRPWVFAHSRDGSLLRRLHIGPMATRFKVGDVRAFLRSKAGG